MKASLVIELIHNIAILLALSLIYDYFWTRKEKKNIFFKMVFGIIIGAGVIILMLTPWSSDPGLFFDTRSVMLSVSGLFFGPVATIIGMIITGSFRYYQGGLGVWMGLTVILTSGSIGILWSYFRPNWRKTNNFFELAGLGILVHLIMLACILLLPFELQLKTFRQIFFTVIFFYPLASVLLVKLMLNQSANRENKKTLDSLEERWKYALEGAGEGVWDWNVVTSGIYFSPQCKSMLGYEDNELEDSYEVWKTLIHPEDKGRVRKFVTEFLVEEVSVFQIEFRLLSKDGRYKWILDRGKLVERTKDGKPLRVVGTQTDISDRKEKEILLKNERFLLDSLLDFTPESIYFKDLNSKFIRVNDASAKGMGCNNISEVIGKSDFDFYAEDYATKTFNDEQEIIRTGKYFHAEEVGHTIDGRETWGITNKMPLRDSNGNIVGTFGLSVNITERKQKEKLLEHERYLVDSLLKYTPVNIYFKDLDSKFIRVNKAAVSNLGCSDGSQMVGKSDFDFFSEKDATTKYEQEQEIIRSGQPISIEERGLRKDGKITWDLTNKLPLYNTEGQITGTFGVSVDITEIKEKELLLEHERYLVDSLLKYSPVNIYFKDLNSKFIRVNDVLVRNLGYTDGSQLIGKSDFDFYSEADATIKFNQEQEIIRSGQPIFMEEHELRKNGKITWGLTNKLPLYNTEGQITGTFGMSVDITEIKEKELLLEHERYLVDSLLKYTPEAIYFKDLDSRFIRVNDAVARSFGCTDTSQVVGKSDFDFYSKETASIAFKQEQEIIRTGIPLSYEEKGVLKDGTDVWNLTNKMPLRDVNGKIIGTFGISIEITKRKLAEDALKESQALYFSFIEQLPNPVFRKDFEGRYVLVNSQFCELKGLTEEDVIGKAPDEILNNPKTTRNNQKNKVNFEDIGEERHKVILQTGESFYDQEVYITPDDELYMDVVRMPVVDHVGNIIGSQGILFDVTERQKAEKALKLSEKSYRELIDGMAETVCVLDLDGNLIDVNKTAVDILGYSKEELLDIGLAGFDSSIVKGKTVRNISSDKIEIIESTHRTKDGRIIPVEVYSSLVTYQGEQVFLSIARDITERLQAEEKVRESEKKLSTLFESMTEMVLMCELVYNQQGDVINYLLYDCNQSFTRMTGIKKEDVVGKMASEVFSSQIQFRFEEYTKVALYGEPYSYADYFEALSKHVLISVVSPKVNHFAVIVADITEIKESQELLAEKNKELENYIYVASHDLRSPLVNIQGFSNRLKKQSDAIKAILDTCQFDAEVKSQLNKITNESIPRTQNFILTNVTKMDRLINGLLQLSRTGRIKMTINKVDTNKLFTEILATYNYQLADLSVKVKLDHLPDCYGDVNQLNQLFSNIIGNAIKYRDPDRELELEISAQRRLDKVIYSIKDNGIGIAQKFLERIWDVFYRVNPISQEPGDGIGLSLVKRITEKHKGKIQVESEVDKGTTFYVELQSNEFSE